MKKSDKATVLSVVPRRLCTQCGMCEAVCPHMRIHLQRDQKGNYWPQGPLFCNDCRGICVNVCPGRGYDPAWNRTQDCKKASPAHQIIGPLRQAWAMQATNSRVQHDCSSGGTVTTIAQYLLGQTDIKGVVMTGMKGLVPFSEVVTNIDNVFFFRGSKYLPVPACRIVRKLIYGKNQKNASFVFIGLPCHVAAVKKAMAEFPQFAKRIALTISLFCGRTATVELTRAMLRKLNIEESEIQQITYRGKGWPGKISITCKDGSVKVVSRSIFLQYWSCGFFNPHRCSLCNDIFGDCADISAGDAWLPDLKNEKAGVNLVVARSAYGENIVKRIIDHDLVTVKKKVSIEDLFYSQIGQCKSKGQGLGTIMLLHKVCGLSVPTFGKAIPAQRVGATIYALLRFAAGLVSNTKYGKMLIEKIPMNILSEIGTHFRTHKQWI